MGHARKLEDDNSSSSPPLNEKLLLATMCIIGLQVHVHVKDGSVFSGLFYTASFDNGFGIVLKNAKITKKGKSKANVASGSVVETLVIMSPNIVQVVAEVILRVRLLDQPWRLYLLSLVYLLQTNLKIIAAIIIGESQVMHTFLSFSRRISKGQVLVVNKRMGHARKLEDDNSSSSPPLNEKLLLATMCIIGLQVHVHVKDGSVFSGLFYTASFDNGFGIVLKNAKITKKGKSKANVASGSVVETLVIMSPNIVQVVAEGVSLPSNVTGNIEGEIVGSAVETLPSKPRLFAANKSKNNCGNHHRREPSNAHIPVVQQEDIQRSSSSLDSMSEPVKPIEEEDKLMPKPISNGFHDPIERSSSSSSSTDNSSSELRQGLEASPNESVPIQAVKKVKEFKLNPEAKNFSPSYTKHLSPSPAAMPDIGNIAYIPSNTPMLPVPETVYAQVGNNPYMPQTITSLPSKFVPYGNLSTVGGFHYPQHMIEPTINMAQPQRFTSPYQSVQAPPPMFANSNPQVMVARSGQLVYVQPVSQNLVQTTLPHPPMLSRPLPPAQPVQYLKQQVAAGQPLQLCVPQPFTTGGLQPYSVPAQFPVMQTPFPTNQPMHIAVPNGFFGTKFP